MTPINPSELIEEPEKEQEEMKEIVIRRSTGNDFNKNKEFIVIKGTIFSLQNISPKKLILRFKGKPNPPLPDGCFVFEKKDGTLLDISEVRNIHKMKSETEKKE